MDFDSMGDQILPSFYAEDPTNAMNAERRRDSLAKCLRVVKSDIEREKKGKAGVENLAKALQETPKFGGEDSQNDVQEKLQHMRSMLTYLEACRCVRIYSSSPWFILQLSQLIGRRQDVDRRRGREKEGLVLCNGLMSRGRRW
jgi:hypothetical protein